MWVCVNERLEYLRMHKYKLIKSLEWAIINNDRLFGQALERELKATLQDIKHWEKIRKESSK